MGKQVVFGPYDREELDVQYNNRERFPDCTYYFGKWADESVRTRDSLPGELDVAYGEHPKETLDIFPAATTNAPVNLFVHGGYWQLFDKSDFSYVARGFVPRDVTTIVINYALAPDVGMDEIVRQNRAAVAWTWKNAQAFGADPERIHVSGHSAGGHLVAMLLATDWAAFASGLPPDIVKSGYAISGLFDLEPIRLCYLNEVLAMDEAVAARNSPVRLAYPVEAPLLIAVGALESEEYHRQARAMETVWQGLDYSMQMMVAPDLDHFTIADKLGSPDSDVVGAQLPLIRS